MENSKKPSSIITYGVLIGGMILVSFVSPLLKEILDLGMTSIAITFYRLFISAIVLWVVILSKPAYRAEIKSIQKRDLGFMCLSGFFYASNMFLWVTALNYSPVFLVSALLRTNPIWVIVGSYLFLKKPTPIKSLYGVGICLFGVAICAWGGATDAHNHPMGMILILISAVMFGFNFLVSGVIRKKFSLWPTMAMSFSFAAIILFILCLVTGEKMGPFSTSAWIWLVVLAIFCTLLAQSASVWALKHINATTVSLINLLGPFFSGLTTFFLRGEIPNVLTVLGTVIMVCGLAVYFRMEARHNMEQRLKHTDAKSDLVEAETELQETEAV